MEFGELAALVELPQEPVRLLLAHPYAQVTRFRARCNERTRSELARRAAASAEPVIVAGDLNLTPWSRAFRDLVLKAKLKDPRRGRGCFGTWPTLSRFPASAAVGVPIDHILVSERLRVSSLSLGPHLGSDHLPIVADIDLPGERE